MGIPFPHLPGLQPPCASLAPDRARLWTDTPENADQSLQIELPKPDDQMPIFDAVTILDGEVSLAEKPPRDAHLYPVHVSTRKSFGLMTRKLSVTESRKLLQFLGTLSRKKSSVASANCPHVA